MIEEMPLDLFNHWAGYMKLHPFGHQDRLLAQLNATTYNVHRGDNEPLDISAFLPIAQPDERNSEKDRILFEILENNRKR